MGSKKYDVKITGAILLRNFKILIMSFKVEWHLMLIYCLGINDK